MGKTKSVGNVTTLQFTDVLPKQAHVEQLADSIRGAFLNLLNMIDQVHDRAIPPKKFGFIPNDHNVPCEYELFVYTAGKGLIKIGIRCNVMEDFPDD